MDIHANSSNFGADELKFGSFDGGSNVEQNGFGLVRIPTRFVMRGKFLNETAQFDGG